MRMAEEQPLSRAYEARVQPAAIQSTTRSPIMITVAWAPPDLGMRGITDASATHNFSTPLTLQYWSTTAIGSVSGPILQVPETCLVVGQNVARRVDPVVGHLFIRVGLQQSSCQSQAFPHPSDVVWMLQITVVEGGLDARVGRSEPDVSRAVGQPQRARYPCRPIRGNITAQIFGPHAGDMLLPFVDDGAGPQDHVVDGARPCGGAVQGKVHGVG